MRKSEASNKIRVWITTVAHLGTLDGQQSSDAVSMASSQAWPCDPPVVCRLADMRGAFRDNDSRSLVENLFRRSIRDPASMVQPPVWSPSIHAVMLNQSVATVQPRGIDEVLEEEHA